MYILTCLLKYIRYILYIYTNMRYIYMGVYGIYGYITTVANNKLIFCHHQAVWFNQQKAHASEIPAIWIQE